MLCQATQIADATVELPSHSPDGPYRLSEEAAIRLTNFALRPLEYFNLAVIHGTSEHYLHDNFYSEDGDASQPWIEVRNSEQFPFPRLDECANDLDRLLDFALTRWHLRQPVIDAFVPHRQALLENVRRRFTGTRNELFQRRLVEIAAQVIGSQAEEWLSPILHTIGPRERLRFLRVGHQCLPHEKGLDVTRQSLSELESGELAAWCLVLSYFRDPSVLDWIEANVREPLTQHWGDLAAVSSFSWERALKWLQSGRPLSLVALDAIKACSGPRPAQSFLVQKMRPRLRSRETAPNIAAFLADCATRDRSPRVTKGVQYIIENLSAILSDE